MKILSLDVSHPGFFTTNPIRNVSNFSKTTEMRTRRRAVSSRGEVGGAPISTLRLGGLFARLYGIQGDHIILTAFSRHFDSTVGIL
jgi:hypothetical protein